MADINADTADGPGCGVFGPLDGDGAGILVELGDGVGAEGLDLD